VAESKPTVSILHRGSFRLLPGVSAERICANAWEVTIPKDEATKKLLRGKLKLEDFDEAVLLIDGVESQYATGTDERADAVVLSVLLP